jgi:hypothetical protein
METLAIISIVASLGSLVIIFGKNIKESSCFCCKIISRTPPASIQYVSAPPPTPEPISRILNHEVIRDCQV